MFVTRLRRPLVVALLLVLALIPAAGRSALVAAASLSFGVGSTADTHDAVPGDGLCADSSSQCTLRAAVEEADAQPQGSAITITIPAGTYALPLGTLALTRNTVTLAGTGASATTLDGQGNRLLVVAVTAFVKIGG